LSDARRPTRRDVLAGAIGGATALLGQAGIAAIRDAAREGAAGGGAPAALPYLVGMAERDLPKGLVRADLRAFKTDSGSDWHEAFASAISSADAVYVPPGEWPVGSPIELSAGKVLWSDSVFDKEDQPVAGAIVRATTPMAAAVRLTGPSAALFGINVDGSGMAQAAVEFASDSVFLGNVSAKRGKGYALKATGSFCTVWGGVFQQPSNLGNAVYAAGSDLIMWGARIKKGAVPLWLDGSGGILGLLHVTGKDEPGKASDATVRVTGPRNQLVNVFYDTAGGPSLLLEGGGTDNRFIGMTIRNSGSNGTFPVIRCDAGQGGQVTNNRFDGFHTDVGRGSGWTFLLEMLGSPDALSGNQLGSGHADGCAQLWNVRPASVGDVVVGGKLSGSGGLAQLSAGAAQLSIAHGLAGAPGCIAVTPSGGPAPEVAVDERSIELTWPSPPGPIKVWWTAEM
jgi:hypothetical protein